MKTLLGNRFAPLTYSIGFLETDFQQVVDAACDWLKPLYAQLDFHEFASPLGDALARLEPLITPNRKFLLVDTDSRWVAYFDNNINGGDPRSFVSYLAAKLGCRGLATDCTPHTRDLAQGAELRDCDSLGFVVYAPGTGARLDIERELSLVNDYGDWTFKASGAALPFEKPAQYQRPRVKDRFTAELLEDYAAALGIRLFDDRFYGTRALLADIRDPLPPDFVPVTLRDAQDRLGIRPAK